jgi:hypothetical protein
MAEDISAHGKKPADPFRMYASPVGARIMQKANKIFEDFPTSKYVVFIFIFTIEIIIAFWVGLHFVK